MQRFATNDQTVEPVAGAIGQAELDELSLRKAQGGSPEACQLLFDIYGHRVHAYLWRMLGGASSKQAVEDLVQETFLRVFKALGAYRHSGPARLSTWILTIANRLALNELRRIRTTRVQLESSQDGLATATQQDGGEAAKRFELGLELAAALSALSDEQRAVVLLHDVHGLTQKEIATALELPEGTVRSRLSRARRELRVALELDDE